MANIKECAIRVCGRGTEVTPALKERVEERINEAVRVMEVDVSSCEVVLRHDAGHTDNIKNTCEITMRVPKSTIRVTDSDPDMYDAIDKAASKASRRLRRYKTRVVNEGRRKARKHIKRERMTFLEDVSQKMFDSDAEAGLIRNKQIDMEPMSDAEALMQMDMLGHDFFLYEDSADGQPSVMYRRHDGGYGILHGIQASDIDTTA